MAVLTALLLVAALAVSAVRVLQHAGPSAGDATGSTSGALACAPPQHLASVFYHRGEVVSLPNRQFYLAVRDNQGHPPGAGDGFWEPYRCPTTAPVLTEELFKQLFANRAPFYTYAAFGKALETFPAFAASGDAVRDRQEEAAFLAHISHETAALTHVVEQNKAAWPNYCDDSSPVGCPAGREAYHGRGPLQLSWNTNYAAAGTVLDRDLLHHPELVETDAVLTWQVSLWYWMGVVGPGTVTAHQATLSGAGFGATIRAINGHLECDGHAPGQVAQRVAEYVRITRALDVAPGQALRC